MCAYIYVCMCAWEKEKTYRETEKARERKRSHCSFGLCVREAKLV